MALKDILTASIIINSSKACHCHLFLTLKSKLTVMLNHYIPRCPFYTVCFAFRRSGVHPPLAIS